MDEITLKNIQNMVGDITEENLKYVDYYISTNLGIFIPSVGYCEYAIKPNHSHPSYSFIVCFSEEHSIVKSKIKVLPYEYLVLALSPEIPHQEEKEDNFTRYIAIFITKEYFENQLRLYTKASPQTYNWMQFTINQEIMIYIKKFMSEFENKQLGSESMLENIACIITNQLIRNVLKLDDASKGTNEQLETEKAIEYMHQNFGQKLTVETLAKLVNMSESHFIRIFKQETNQSPIEYLIKLRMVKAKKLLRDRTISITQIALQCGFHSNSHFSTCFAKQLGVTPSEYRNLYCS